MVLFLHSEKYRFDESFDVFCMRSVLYEYDDVESYSNLDVIEGMIGNDT